MPGENSWKVVSPTPGRKEHLCTKYLQEHHLHWQNAAGSLCAMLQAHECENNHCSAFCTLWPWRQKFKVSFFVACVTCTCILRFDMQCMLCFSEHHKEKTLDCHLLLRHTFLQTFRFPYIFWFDEWRFLYVTLVDILLKSCFTITLKMTFFM